MKSQSTYKMIQYTMQAAHMNTSWSVQIN